MSIIKMPFWCNIVNDCYAEEKKSLSVSYCERGIFSVVALLCTCTCNSSCSEPKELKEAVSIHQ